MAEQQQQDPRNFVSTFTDGLLTDIDHINFAPNKHKDACNIEIIDKDGQGYVMTLQDGNKTFFSITSGFRPMGSCFINGILYIVSQNSSNEGEIGCFPSPVSWSKANTQFERTYKPLNNFTGPIKDPQFRKAMRTMFLRLNPNRFVDIRAKQVYDGSINLYLTDGLNPLRVINTGFNQNGGLTDKIYCEGDFRHLVNVIRGAETQVNIGLKKYMDGGRWRSGNTFLYARYVTEDFNKTNFLGESLAIPVTNFPVKAGVPGNPGTHAIDDVTSKSLEIELSNLDSNYTFIEIAFIRYFSEENGIMVHESKLINHRYRITGTTMTLRLTGYEQFIDVAFEEIIKPNNQENICETIEITENRLWGANWKRSNIHDPALATYALKFRVLPKVTTIIKEPTAGEMPTPTYPDLSIYGNPENYNKVGYFRGETYAFQMFFVYDDGTESMGYPLTGFDFYDSASNEWNASIYDTAPAKRNEKGIVRFPSIFKSPAYSIMNKESGSISGKAIHYHIMGVQVDMKIAPGQLPMNVKGYYIARADRIPNLIAQGVLMQGCVSTIRKTQFLSTHQDLNIHSRQDSGNLYTMSFSDYMLQASANPDSEGGYWGFTQRYNREGIIHPTDYSVTDNKVVKVMPFYRGYYPVISYWRGEQWKFSMNRAFYVSNHYGLFSPDYILDPTKKMNNGVITRLGKIAYYDPYLTKNNQPYNQWWINLYDNPGINQYTQDINRKGLYTGTFTSYPRAHLLEMKSVLYYSTEDTITPAEIENVEKYTTPTDAKKFVSWYKDCGLNNNEAGNQGDESMVYGIQKTDDKHFMCNRTMVTPRYIGFVLNSSDAGKTLDLELVNSYRYNPKSQDYDILNIYNLQSASFSRISKTYAPEVTSFPLFGGDCFLQASYIKVMGHGGSTMASDRNEFPGEDGTFKEYVGGTGNNNRIGHGTLMMFVTENSVNAELRVPVKSRTFFPHMRDFVIHAHVSSESKNRSETDLLNWGYNRILSPKELAAYNFDLPETMNIFPNRVRYSNRDIPGSYVDSFSTFEYLSYKDFDVSAGPIRRLYDLSGWLIGICQNKSLSFYVNANQIKSDPSADNILLGISDIIHDNARTLLDVGSQFFAGSINTGKNIVGLDWNKKAVFTITLQVTDKGSFPVAVNQSEALMCKNFIEEIVTTESGTIIDRTNVLRDNVPMGRGVVCSEDNGRVFISIHGQNRVAIVYNENLGRFIGRSNFVPYFAAKMDNNLISWNENNQGWLTAPDAPKSSFFGVDYESYVQAIVNPFGIFEKVYDALVLHTPDKEIQRIEYKTETQDTVHVFPVATTPRRPWQDPVFKEDKLYVPTFPESKNFYNAIRHVHLRGTWLAIKVVFDRTTPTYLKNILTKFRISKS